MRTSKTITVVGCHAEGEVGRVITGGVLPPPGDSLFEQKHYLETHGDDLRKFLLYEPRGGAHVHANLIVPAIHPDADAGFIIMEATDYPPMSGSNSICVATVLLETGMVAMQEPETRMLLETPGGLIEAVAHCNDGQCKSVSIQNIPSFVALSGGCIELEGVGKIAVDIAYGGAFFAIVDAAEFGFTLIPEEARELVELGERIKEAVVKKYPVVHPENPAIHSVTFTQFAGQIERDRDGRLTGRNAVVISPGKIDRSPCGTGSSARLALMYSKNEIEIGESFFSQSIIGSEFHCGIVSTKRVGDTTSVVPRIEGRGWITGIHQYCLDPSDPFPHGFTLSDTWYRALS